MDLSLIYNAATQFCKIAEDGYADEKIDDFFGNMGSVTLAELGDYIKKNSIKYKALSKLSTDTAHPWGLLLFLNGKKYVVLLNGTTDMNQELDTCKTVNDFMNDVSYDDSYDQYVIGKDFNKEFWEGPGELYHGTSKDNVASILEEGLGPRSHTRGISNRSVGAAVFTSASLETTANYYDVTLKIDCDAMKADGLTPYVSQEPDIERYEMVSQLAYVLGEDDYNADIEQGMDHDTVIIHGHIPAKYISVVED